MKKRIIQTISLSLALLIWAGCAKQEESSSKAIQSFEVKGVLLRIESEGRTLVIDHEEITGYMGAMTMPFRVKDVSESEKAQPGDEISFTYKVAEYESWVEGIEPTGKTRELKSPTAPPDPTNKLLKVGDLFPDFRLSDENGSPVQLNDHRGQIVALTFIFTRCPVPEYCPAMMRNFSSVEKLLKTDPDVANKFKLLTVSFDSDYDTPEIMKAYGEQFGKSSKNWSLLTSPETKDIRSLGESVGLMFGKNDSAIYTHNLRTVVIDAQGRIAKIFTDESWKPEELVAAIKLAGKEVE